MKKIIFSFLLGLSLCSKLWAGVSPPLDQTGHPIQSISFVGALPCNIDSSTGTVPVLCAQGRMIVYGVIASSIAATDYIVFRDSATANLSSSTGALVYANMSQNNTGAANTNQNPTSQMILFPVPIRFLNGISVNDAATPVAGAIARWTILYRPMLATE